ncbi:hypothetical protein PaeCFBP13512_02920 [Paenibacillus sp. CFBP13512]|uniref:phosphotransferase n=1 Tax=Paenibacillus sp. CFBP13512 TaxID=2184007 RepID=UPI0010C0CF64|nr:phosphotransferase [Paenibacillus sp. CFBP13512]TKJ93367.1 hypothetical protein PaeCFBP13512_02920 [Paenibacillus sp. CFBP13512]
MLKPLDLDRGFIPESILSQTLKEYGIDDYITYPYLNMNGTAVPINRVSETSRRALIESQDGSLYFMKEVPWYVESIEYAKSIIQLQYELSVKGIKVPEVILTTSKKLFVHIDTNKILYLQKYILNSNMYKNYSEQIYAAGKELRDFEIKAASVFRLNILAIPQYSPYESAKNVLVLLLKKFIKKRSEMKKEDQEEIQNFVRACRKLIDQWSTQHGQISGKQESIIHGDLNPMNFIFSNKGSVSGLIDFDNACIADPLVDVAEGLLTFAGVTYRENSSRLASINELEFSNFEQFLNGYTETHGLALEEREVLPLLIATAGIRLASLGLIRGDWPISSASDHIQVVMKNLKLSQNYLRQIKLGN